MFLIFLFRSVVYWTIRNAINREERDTRIGSDHLFQAKGRPWQFSPKRSKPTFSVYHSKSLSLFHIRVASFVSSGQEQNQRNNNSSCRQPSQPPLSPLLPPRESQSDRSVRTTSSLSTCERICWTVSPKLRAKDLGKFISLVPFTWLRNA